METSKRAKRALAPLSLLCADLIWGMGFVAQKQADAIPAITMASWRSGFAALSLLILVLLFDRRGVGGRHLLPSRTRGQRRLDLTRAELVGGAVCGVMLSLATVLQQAGMNQGTDGGKAAFITALYVVLVPVLAWALLRRRSALHVWVSVGVSVVGFYLMCVTDTFSIAPSDLLVLGCAVVFAFHILAVDASVARGDGLRISLVQFVTMFVLTTAIACLTQPQPSPELFLAHVPSVLYLGIGSSGVAYTLQIVGQKGMPPAVASVLLSLESVVALIGSAIVLGERMSVREGVGTAVVFLAVLLSQVDLPALLRCRKNKQKSA